SFFVARGTPDCASLHPGYAPYVPARAADPRRSAITRQTKTSENPMKHHPSRRELLGLIGSSAALAPWLTPAPVSADSTGPDLVVFNAKVYTVDPQMPRAEAFAIKAGRFIAVGASEEIKSLAGRRTRTYDARQMTVVPGFIDAHNHAPGGILLYEVL